MGTDTREEPTGFIMGQVIFLYRSLAYRSAAHEILRKARGLPHGSERRTACRYALALRELARNEAWLEGRVSDASIQTGEPKARARS